MRTQTLNVDLHCHSTASDGLLPPKEVAQRAAANGVQVWALTDHDELSGIDEARTEAQKLGMQFIAGVEVSVTWAGRTVHIVGLNVEDHQAQINDELAYIRAGREQRAKEIGDKLTGLGIKNAYEGALRYVSNPSLISRTHFARFLVEEGYCANMGEVFKRYLGDHKAAFVPMQWATLAQSVNWIREAGGKAIIAHPGRYEFTPVQFGALFDEFKALGGIGIEVVTGSHRPDQYAEYAQVAKHYGFEISCGSDFHAPGEGRLDLGTLPPSPAGLPTVWDEWLA